MGNKPENLTLVTSCRLARGDHIRLAHKAKALGLSMSSFIRQLLIKEATINMSNESTTHVYSNINIR